MRIRNLLLIVIASLALPVLAAAQDHWIATWAAAPQQGRGGGPPAGRGGGAAARGGAAPAPTSFSDQTIRMTVHTSFGGRRARLTLSNAYGNMPLGIGAVHVARQGNEPGTILQGSDRAVMFNAKPAVSIPPGAQMISDPVDLDVPQLGNLIISVYVPGESGQLTTHGTGLHTTYIAKGNEAADPVLKDASMARSYYFISAIDVTAPAEAGVIVAFGDSITDGATSTNDADRQWPSILASRLLSTPGAPKLAVVNQGISGNRLLADGAGVNALARFDRDVLGMPGVKWLMLMEGINDIGVTTGPPRGNAPPAANPVTSDELIGAMKQMIDRAHAHGIKVIGCTLTPYQGAAYYSDKGEEIRQTVNRWIRTGRAFDGVVDFEKATEDPATKTFKMGFNNGDHLHPNDQGYKAMADAIDLKVFSATK